MAVLGWWELPEEDQPPERYWGDDEALQEWFAAVKVSRTPVRAALVARPDLAAGYARQADRGAQVHEPLRVVGDGLALLGGGQQLRR